MRDSHGLTDFATRIREDKMNPNRSGSTSLLSTATKKSSEANRCK